MLGFSAVLLLNTRTLGAACTSIMSSRVLTTLLFNVIKHHGYKQDPQDVQGGTGCFVLLACLKTGELPKFSSTQSFTVLPKVEFSPAHYCFYSSPPPGTVDEEETNPTLSADFFACLSTFVDTKDSSTLWCLPSAGKDQDLLWAARPFLWCLRHCILLQQPGEEAKATFPAVAASAIIQAGTLLSLAKLPVDVDDVSGIIYPLGLGLVGLRLGVRQVSHRGQSNICTNQPPPMANVCDIK